MEVGINLNLIDSASKLESNNNLNYSALSSCAFKTSSKVLLNEQHRELSKCGFTKITSGFLSLSNKFSQSENDFLVCSMKTRAAEERRMGFIIYWLQISFCGLIRPMNENDVEQTNDWFQSNGRRLNGSAMVTKAAHSNQTEDGKGA